MAKASFYLVEPVGDGTRVEQRGVVRLVGDKLAFAPAASLPAVEAKRAKNAFETAKEEIDAQEGLYFRDPYMARVRPWQGYYGTLNALASALPAIGWEIDRIDDEDVPEVEEGDALPSTYVTEELPEWGEIIAERARAEYWAGEDQ